MNKQKHDIHDIHDIESIACTTIQKSRISLASSKRIIANTQIISSNINVAIVNQNEQLKRIGETEIKIGINLDKAEEDLAKIQGCCGLTCCLKSNTKKIKEKKEKKEKKVIKKRKKKKIESQNNDDDDISNDLNIILNGINQLKNEAINIGEELDTSIVLIDRIGMRTENNMKRVNKDIRQMDTIRS